MTKPLSNDLRVRLIDAVGQGMSCRAAADRFGIAASTAVKLLRRWRDTGMSTPRPQGGDKRSDRIEAHAEEVLGLIADRVDITSTEISAHLEQVHEERFAPSTIWRLLDRHAQTFKKKPRTPASRSARTWRRKDRHGASPGLICAVSSSSTRPELRPR
jgi:transposase